VLWAAGLVVGVIELAGLLVVALSAGKQELQRWLAGLLVVERVVAEHFELLARVPSNLLSGVKVAVAALVGIVELENFEQTEFVVAGPFELAPEPEIIESLLESALAVELVSVPERAVLGLVVALGGVPAFSLVSASLVVVRTLFRLPGK